MFKFNIWINNYECLKIKIKCKKKSELNKYEMQQNKMWKKTHERNKRNERRKKNEWMQRGGGAASIKGGAENKRKKQERGRANGPVDFGLGRFNPWTLGRFGRKYITVLRPIFFHFPLFFFSLPLSREWSSLLSPSFHEEHGGALPRNRRVSRRWGGFPAVVGRPVRRRTTPET